MLIFNYVELKAYNSLKQLAPVGTINFARYAGELCNAHTKDSRLKRLFLTEPLSWLWESIYLGAVYVHTMRL